MCVLELEGIQKDQTYCLCTTEPSLGHPETLE